MSREKEKLIETSNFMREAKNNLVLACLSVDAIEGFDNTVEAIKSTIGDLMVCEKIIEDTIQRIDFPDETIKE